MSAARSSLGLGLGLALAWAACTGYADLPVPERETATVTTEALELHPGAAGLLQLAVTAEDLPAGVEGPLWVVTGPALSTSTRLAVNWAVGPCPALDGPSDPVLLRLCVAVESVPELPPEPFLVQLVVESRVADRRFTLVGEVTP